MPPPSNSTPPQLDRPFRLIATDARVLAQNAAGKLIDIGEIARGADGACTIRLDVDGIETGPQSDAQAALEALVPMLTFDYLDGLFTAEGDAHFDGLIDTLPHLAFTLPEALPRALTERNPPQRF